MHFLWIWSKTYKYSRQNFLLEAFKMEPLERKNLQKLNFSLSSWKEEGGGRGDWKSRQKQSPWNLLPKLPGHRFPGAAPPSQRQWSPCSHHQSGSWKWDLPWWSGPGLWKIYPGHSEMIYETGFIQHPSVIPRKEPQVFLSTAEHLCSLGLFGGRFLTLYWSVHYLFTFMFLAEWHHPTQPRVIQGITSWISGIKHFETVLRLFHKSQSSRGKELREKRLIQRLLPCWKAS